MSSSKPTYVIVHGAYHRPAHFDELANLLRQHGHEVLVPALPSVGAAKDPGDALSKDAAVIASAVRSITEAGKNAVVFMHSYGGMAGSEGVAMVCEKQKAAGSSNGHEEGSILGLVFLNAYVLHRGDSFIAEHTPEKDPKAATFPTTVSDSGMMTFHDARAWYYSSTSPEKADAAAAMLEPMSLSAFTESTRYGGVDWAQYDIPVHYIGCKKDETIPLFMQKDFVKRMENAGVNVTATWLDQDHSPFLDAPERVTELILSAARTTRG